MRVRTRCRSKGNVGVNRRDTEGFHRSSLVHIDLSTYTGSIAKGQKQEEIIKRRGSANMVNLPDLVRSFKQKAKSGSLWRRLENLWKDEDAMESFLLKPLPCFEGCKAASMIRRLSADSCGRVCSNLKLYPSSEFHQPFINIILHNSPMPSPVPLISAGYV
jgi:hypothetical protein